MTAPEIGVLLPVQMEMRFVAPGEGSEPADEWRLRVRVLPDAVSVTDHDPVPSVVELDTVEAMWEQAGSADLNTPAGRRAWAGLVAAVGVERAAWLARTFPPTFSSEGGVSIDRPANTREGLRRSQLAGLPPTIELWLARGGGPPERAVEMTVLVDEVDLDFADPEGEREAWWTSFDEAVRVGLAVDVELGPQRPNDIDVIYAIGIGAGDPGPLLAVHADSGRLGLMEPGMATTSVDGRSLTALGDPDEWRELVASSGVAQAGTTAMFSTLAGASTPTQGITAVPGGGPDHRPLNRALVATLWPALWGHSLIDVNDVTDGDRLGVWAVDNVIPEGPLPALRVGRQPYGILPVTSLGRWRRASGDPAVEAELVPVLRRLVERWAGAAEGPASTRLRGDLGDLLATPNATSYAWRWMVPVEIAQGVAFRFGAVLASREVGRWWDRQAAVADRLPSQPSQPNRRLVSVGWGHDVETRLVEATSSRNDGLERLAELRAASIPDLLERSVSVGGRRLPLDESLLTELARHSVVASAAGVARTAARQPRAVVEPLGADERQPTELERWARRFRGSDLREQRGAAASVHRNVLAGIDTLVGQRRGDVERALRATLDTATHRIDPWATAVAWRRLQTLATAPRSLGVYGWVDAPRPRASTLEDEFLLAPSVEQATVSALLRDRALRDPDADRWQMDLESDTIREALRIADEVRDGGHPTEVLGRLVERIVSRRDTINRLRREFPLIANSRLTRYRVRRVCNGADVLTAAIDDPTRLTDLGVAADQLNALSEAGRAVDALGDLHVADATYGIVQGRPAATRAAHAAAAGVAAPPRLSVMRTDRAGRNVTSSTVVVLPAEPAPPTPTPAEVADPSVAAYLNARAGDPSGPDWTWVEVDPDAGSPVTLADAELQPADTVGLGAGNLAQVIADFTGAGELESSELPGHARVRALAAALAGSPALPEDVAEGATVTSADEVHAELVGRYRAVRAAANATAGLLVTAGNSTDIQELRSALRTAGQWGITPQVGVDNADSNLDLVTRVQRAAEVLVRRVNGASGDDEAASLTVGELAAAIAELVSPEAPFPVAALLPSAALAELAPATGATQIDPDWLEVISAVRPNLARLEATQLDAASQAAIAMDAWTSRPDDVWQTEAIVDENDVPVPSRLVVAFGPPLTLPGPTSDEVAVVLIDRFVEVIPDGEHDSGVAFQHELPDSRAPQAVLLAVPPVVEQELSTDVLIDIVAETRQLTRARVADPDQIGGAVNTLHLAAMSAAGRAAIRVGGE